MDQTKIDALRTQLVQPQSNLIDGLDTPASDGGTMEVVSPLDGTTLTMIARGTPADMDAAIASASRAFQDRRWAGQPPSAGGGAMT